MQTGTVLLSLCKTTLQEHLPQALSHRLTVLQSPFKLKLPITVVFLALSLQGILVDHCS